jgi:hypothetical protein
LTEIEELQRILDDEETSPISRTERINRKCMNLTSAAVAIAAEEAAVMCVTTNLQDYHLSYFFFSRKSFATINEEELEAVYSEEYVQARHAMEQYKMLPPVQVRDESSRPLGHGVTQYNDLDFEMLIEMRRKHQTKQAASGVRTKKTNVPGDTLRGQIIRQFHEALKEAQDERAAGTGVEWDVQWRGEAPATGNAANAAAVAATVSKKVSLSLLSSTLSLH